MQSSGVYEPGHGGFGAGAALGVHLLAGFGWIFVLANLAANTVGDAGAGAWGASAFILWLRAAERIRREPAADAWSTSLQWWVWSLVAPIALGLVALKHVPRKADVTMGEGASDTTAGDATVLERVDALEREVTQLRRDLEALAPTSVAAPQRRTVPRAAAPPPAPPRAAQPRPAPPKPPAAPQPRATPPAPPASPRTPEPPPPAPRPRRELEVSTLFGAKTLAWTGGAVTALGIVFLFALAVNHGWIGPTARVVLGGIVSAAIFGAGLEIARRYGRLYAAYGAVGAGLAGGYATSLAATGLYDLVPEAAGLVLAGCVAAAGLAVALRWSSEMVAGLGLIGAGVVPVLLLGETDGPTVLGTSFTAIVLAAIAVVGVVRGWRVVLGVGTALAVVETLGLFVWEEELTTSLLILGSAVWAVLTATGIAWHLLREKTAVGSLTSAYVLGSGAFAWWSVAALFADEPQSHRGIALLVAAAVYGALAVVLWHRRDLAVLLAIVALSVAAIGVADALSGGSLTYAWAIEAAALAVAGRMLRERRFQLAGLGYLVLAGVHALAVEAQPDRLVEPFTEPASGVPSLLAVAVAAAVVGLQARIADEPRAEGVFALLRPAFGMLRKHARGVRQTLFAVAALLVADAAALGTLQLAQWAWDGTDRAFAYGQLVLTAAGSLAAVALAAAGWARRSSPLHILAAGSLALLAYKVAGVDAGVSERIWPWSLAALAAAMLVCSGLLEHRRRAGQFGAELALAELVTSLALAVAAAYGRLDDSAFGWALFGIAGVYCSIAAAFFGTRHRDYSTVAAGLGLAAAAVAEAWLLDGQAVPILWAATAAGLMLLARATSEPRLQIAGLGYLAAAAVPTFVLHAPPIDFVRASEHPATGLASVLALAVAAAVAAAAARPLDDPQDELDRQLARLQPILAGPGRWVAALVGLYALSLAILELAERFGTKDLAANFRAGHAAVSAVWGALGLVLLYVGLRRAPALRLAGFALFGVSLAKLFLYDLSRLSSITRALSFLAVGAILLLAGFFYQRLGENKPRDGAEAANT